jgi:hypothetical protein
MKHTVPVHPNSVFKQTHKNLEKSAHDTTGAQLSPGPWTIVFLYGSDIE